MLPEILSSNLCSLKDNKLRYAFSVVWTLKETNNSSINIENVKFFKSLIKSRAFTYQKAQNMIDDTLQYVFICFLFWFIKSNIKLVVIFNLINKILKV